MYKRQVADTAKENEKLREALAQADVGNQETQALVDAVLTAVVLEHGERAMDPDAPETALGLSLIHIYLVSLKDNKTYNINGDTYSDHDLVRIKPHIDRCLLYTSFHKAFEVHIQISAGFMNLFTLPGLCLSLGLEASLLGLLPLTIPIGIAINCPPSTGFFFLLNGHYDSSFAVLV